MLYLAVSLEAITVYYAKYVISSYFSRTYLYQAKNVCLSSKIFFQIELNIFQADIIISFTPPPSMHDCLCVCLCRHPFIWNVKVSFHQPILHIHTECHNAKIWEKITNIIFSANPSVFGIFRLHSEKKPYI